MIFKTIFTKQIMFLLNGLSIYFFTVLFVHISASQDNDTDSNLISCAVKIVNDYAVQRPIVFFEEEESNSNLWGRIVRKIKKPFIITSQTVKTNKKVEKFLVVLFPNASTDYTKLLQKLRKSTYFLIVGKSLMIIDMVRILKQFHKMEMIFEVFLMPNGSSVDIYTTKPFKENDCNVKGHPENVDRYETENFLKNITFFSSKKYWNLQGCTLTCLGISSQPDVIVMQDESGKITFQRMAKDLLDFLSKKLNFKTNIILPYNSSLELMWLFYNDTANKIAKMLRNREADFALGTFSILAFSNDSSFVLGESSQFECYTWATPIRAGKRLSIMTTCLNEFADIIWLLIVLSAFTAVFAIVVITRVLDVHKKLQYPLNAFYFILSTAFNQPYSLKKPLPSSLRILISTWLLYCLVITTAYQATLLSFMTVPWQVENIHSLSDLINSPLEIGGSQQMMNLIKSIHSNNREILEIIKKFQVLPPLNFSELINRISTKRDLAVFGEKRYIEAYSDNLERMFDTKKVFFLDGCVFRSISTPLLFPKGSPLIDPFNKILSQLIQNGLMQKFTTLRGENSITETKLYQAETSQHYEKLKLIHLQGIFVILLFGYAISVFIFVCEILFSRGWNMCQNIKIYIRNLY